MPKYALMKKVAGGLCYKCERIPTKMVSYDVHKALLIEKYCDKCFENWEKLKSTLSY